jgi:hypothetical protein
MPSRKFPEMIVSLVFLAVFAWIGYEAVYHLLNYESLGSHPVVGLSGTGTLGGHEWAVWNSPTVMAVALLVTAAAGAALALTIFARRISSPLKKTGKHWIILGFCLAASFVLMIAGWSATLRELFSGLG